MKRVLVAFGVLIAALVLVLVVWLVRKEDRYGPLFAAVDALRSPLRERSSEAFRLQIRFSHASDDGQTQGSATLTRVANDRFAFRLVHPDLSLDIHRTPDACVLSLPEKGVVFRGEGHSPTGEDALVLDALVSAILRLDSDWASIAEALASTPVRMLAAAAAVTECEVQAMDEEEGAAQEYRILLKGKRVADARVSRVEDRLTEVRIPREDGGIALEPTLEWGVSLPDSPGTSGQVVTVPRHELERSLRRGLVRLVGIEHDRIAWRDPEDSFVGGSGGYRWVSQGQRIVKLKGGAFDIGRQHGQFLGPEVRKMLDSTLYVVGMLHSFETGKWFLDEIRAATRRLDPHTPKEFLEEMAGLAKGSGCSFEEVHLANYFPALFHCSGFAVQGKATVDGKLYHGRVLDYMTGVGLQNSATVFVVEKEGKIPFVNVGYAGFVGSVTGMNLEHVSLGEMGGSGDGLWDGVPMPILMRMSLEQARTLDQARAIFRDNPRTCEYYYVFADGKDRSAVGVEATPDKIKFVEFGQTHPDLRHPVEDCVLLSAGDRYENLFRKVQEQYGRIDATRARQLMDHPVAMRHANLHSVLFCPEELTFWVANAGSAGPAYKEPFYRYSLPELLARGNGGKSGKTVASLGK